MSRRVSPSGRLEQSGDARHVGTRGRTRLHRRPLRAVRAIVDRERELAETMVAQCGGDRRLAAAALGMSVSTLKRRLLGTTRPRVLRYGRAHE